MAKKFNIAGLCLPEYHYMVDISDKVEEITSYIEAGEYFTMNRARQYGKTTTLEVLKERLQKEYTVFSISFEGLTSETFASENTFCTRFFSLLYDSIEFDEAEHIPDEIKEELFRLSTDESGKIDFHMMAGMITKICRESPRPVVLMIDEIDQASNNEIFAAFLGQLRVLYLKRNKRQTFRSVILAGVCDIKNLKVKIRSEKDHEKNSPWNIAADFDVEMRLSEHGIAGMLENYEQDYHTGMDIKTLAGLIYDYTSGYPFLVSRICKLLDEKIAGSEPFPARRDAWSKEGFLAAIRILLAEKNTLFESLTGKLQDYPELKEMIFEILFSGKSVPFRPLNPVIGTASMFGFIINQDGNVAIANRIFETVLYNLYLSLEETHLEGYQSKARKEGGSMNAWVLHDINDFSLETVEEPIPGKNEVLVEVKAAGICGSDIPRVYQNGTYSFPLIPGHEFSGAVAKTGRDVDDGWIGRRVGIFPLIPCMECIPCRKKQYEMCRNYSYLGSRTNGGFAEYAAVPAENLIALPDNVTFEEAAMLEPMAVAVHAMRRAMPDPENIVAVCGLGTIGLLLIMFLREAGVKNILAIGNKEFQKQMLGKLGLTEAAWCDSRKQDAGRWLTEHTGGAGADIFFECVGKNETLTWAIDHTAPGGRVKLVGNPFSDMTLEKSIYWKILRNQLIVTGTWNSSFSFPEEEFTDRKAEETEKGLDDWQYVLDRLARGRVSPSCLITHRFQLDELEKGFHIMRDKTEDYIKIMGIRNGIGNGPNH